MILSSGKTGADKYDNRAIAPTKVLPRLDMRILGQSLQRFFQFGRGYSLSGVEGASEALNDLSVTTTSNINDYQDDFTKNIQTLIANGCLLDVDSASTANNIILKARKITSSNAPDGGNYTAEAPLPFEFKDGLRFSFRATLSNTGITQAIINNLVGMPSAVDVLNETNTALAGGEIVSGRFYELVCATISTVKTLILVGSNIRGVANIEDIRSSDSTGGSGTGGMVANTRTLNSLSSTIAGLSLASNQITIPAGIYDIEFVCGAYGCGDHLAVIRNITTGTDIVQGVNSRATALTGDFSSANVVGKQIVNIASTSILELLSFVDSASQLYTFGSPASSGRNEIYSRIFITKLN